MRDILSGLLNSAESALSLINPQPVLVLPDPLYTILPCLIFCYFGFAMSRDFLQDAPLFSDLPPYLAALFLALLLLIGFLGHPLAIAIAQLTLIVSALVVRAIEAWFFGAMLPLVIMRGYHRLTSWRYRNFTFLAVAPTSSSLAAALTIATAIVSGAGAFRTLGSGGELSAPSRAAFASLIAAGVLISPPFLGNVFFTIYNLLFPVVLVVTLIVSFIMLLRE